MPASPTSLPTQEPNPIRSPAPDAAGNSLPRPLTSFIGRDREIAAVQMLLARDVVRLITPTGPGGVGKTRLAIRAGSTIDGFTDGVWFVALASVRNPDQVPATIASALGIPGASNRSAEQTLVDFFGNIDGLLILDNFEQILDAAVLVSDLLQACPQLTVMATSRTRLRLSSERVFAVPPMSLPDTTRTVSLERLGEVDTIRLFIDRADAAASGFSLDPGNAPVVADICRRLDGLPLAIELAAARVDAFSPADLLRRLDTRLSLLTEGARDQPLRLQSLHASIAWSYDLLTPDEQVIFRRLGVFPGPWTLEAAEAVIPGGDDGPGLAVVDGIASLIDKNLARREITSTGESQYVLLETIREFAVRLFSGHEEHDVIRGRHARFICGLVEQYETAIFLPHGGRLRAQLKILHASVTDTFTWLEREQDIGELLRLALSITQFWLKEGRLRDGRASLARWVAIGRAEEPPMIGKALMALGLIVHMQGDEALALEIGEECLSLIERQDSDGRTRFYAQTLIGIVSLRTGNLDQAAAAQVRALALLQSMQDEHWARFAESTVLGNLGNIAVARGDIPSAREWFEKALDRQRMLGYEPGTSHQWANHPIAGLGDVARAENNLVDALDHYQLAVELAHRFDDYRARAYALGGVAGTLAAAGGWKTAARLFGADEALHARADFHFDLETMDRQRALGLPEPWKRESESFGCGQPLRDALWAGRANPLPPIPDPEAAAAWWEAGRKLSLEEAVGEALAIKLDTPPPVSGPNFEFTVRELQVLKLLADGRSNRAIARDLSLSVRTVENHVLHILTKLDVDSRTAAATYALRHGIV